MGVLTMDVVVKWNLHASGVMWSAHRRVRTKILRQVMNLQGTVPCSSAVIADLEIVLMAIVFGRGHRFTIKMVKMNFGAW